MSTTPLADGMQALINYANETTGETDATLSDAIDSLVSGYGSGGGSTPSGDGWVSGKAYEFDIIENKYYESGVLASYNGWNATNMIPCYGVDDVCLSVGFNNSYCFFYDENRNKISSFNASSRFKVNNDVYYFSLSAENTKVNSSLKIVPIVFEEV